MSHRTSLGTLISGGTPLATQGVLSSVGDWGEATVRAESSGLSTPRASAEELRLVSCIATGDQAALRELYDHCGSFVYSVAVRVTQDRRAAEDVAQQVFVRVWERPTRFDPERGSLRTWLATLAHRRAVDHVRREQACHRREHRQLTEAPSDVEEAATSSALAERVRRAVDALPDDQRSAIRLATTMPGPIDRWQRRWTSRRGRRSLGCVSGSGASPSVSSKKASDDGRDDDPR